MSNKAKSNNRRFWIWAPVVIGALILAIILVLPGTHSKGPSYAGRSAESWLRGSARFSASPEIDLNGFDYSLYSTASAFDEMGTNGVLFLLKALERRDSAFAAACFRILTSLPVTLGKRMPRPLSAAELTGQAVRLLSVIHDPEPDVTFPRIVQFLSSGSPQARVQAVSVIQTYVSRYRKLDVASSRPEMIRALADTNLFLRLQLVIALNRAGLGGPEAVGALQPLLTNSDLNLRSAAKRALD